MKYILVISWWLRPHLEKDNPTKETTCSKSNYNDDCVWLEVWFLKLTRNKSIAKLGKRGNTCNGSFRWRMNWITTNIHQAHTYWILLDHWITILKWVWPAIQVGIRPWTFQRYFFIIGLFGAPTWLYSMLIALRHSFGARLTSRDACGSCFRSDTQSSKTEARLDALIRFLGNWMNWDLEIFHIRNTPKPGILFLVSATSYLPDIEVLLGSDVWLGPSGMFARFIANLRYPAKDAKRVRFWMLLLWSYCL